jgi:hypothetical protein
MQKFFEIDFDAIYPPPTSKRLAEAFFNRLWRKLHIDNFSLLITFYGMHRVGKSLCAVDFAYILDETFEPNMENRVVYNGKDLINAFKEIREKRIRGGAVIVDEAGSGELASQRWYEDAAKIISAELQAVGYLNPFIGFVTQSFSFINSTARKLSQGVFEVSRTGNNYSTVKPFWIENNPWTTSTYKKYPIFCEKHNNVVSNVYKINCIRLGLTPEVIRLRYETHSQAYKDQLLVQSEEDMQLLDSMKQQKKVLVSGIEALVTEVYKNLDDYTAKSRQKGNPEYLNKDLIRHRHPELSDKDAKLVKALVEKKLGNTRHPVPKHEYQTNNE